MTLTEHQALNTSTPAFDVQFRYFAGPDYVVLAKGGITAALNTWTTPDSPPANWYEITDRVSYASQFTELWQGNSITWTAELSGWDYSDTFLALGLSLACWRRIWRPTGTGSAPAGWQAWERFFIGEIVNRNDHNDYQNGKPWTRSITGVNFYLSGINAPRITAGKIRVTEGASVTGNGALAQPELERDQGEFVGGTASVALANVVDGNRNTVYISSAMPQQTENAWPSVGWDGNTLITEVFLKPLAGWTTAKTWWVEVYNARSQSAEMNVPLQLAVRAGDGTITYYNANEIKTHTGCSSLIVAHRRTFDEYVGGENIGAEQIYDISEHSGVQVTLDGAIMCGNQIFAWAPGGAVRDYKFPIDNGTMDFYGATHDSSTLPVGSSWWWNQTAGAWQVNANPHPGANNNGVGPIWLKVELPDNVCRTLDQISLSSTTIRLDNYRAWLKPGSGEHAYGVVSSCVFEWTNRDGNGLHGVTWVNAPGAPIPANTRCYPYVADEAMTGYPLTNTHLVRRKLPTIEHYKVYWSKGTARGYPETGWANDYYTLYHEQQGNTQSLRLSDSCADGSKQYLWVRTVMYLIYAMTDGGRVKVNEVEVDLAQLALDLAGGPAVDGQNSSGLAQYLWYTWAGLSPGDFVDESASGSHKMGQHALAITPVVKVLDDLAGTTGCLADFARTGGIIWRENPWWPKNSTPAASPFSFDASSVRGEVNVTQTPAQVDYVILNALSLEGEAHALRVVYPQPSGTTEPPVAAMVQEVNDRVVARDADGQLLAQVELEKLTLGNRTCQLTVKGVGEWCHAGQKIGLFWDYTGSGTQYWTWLITQVRMAASESNGQKTFETTLQLTGFRS